MPKIERILIVGAGIAGLALAAALRRRAMSAVVIERAPAPAAGGAGLYIVGAGTRGLRALGVAESALRESRQIHAQAFFTHRGTRLAEIDVGRFWSGCGPCIGVARTVLHHALFETANADVRFGISVQLARRGRWRSLGVLQRRHGGGLRPGGRCRRHSLRRSRARRRNGAATLSRPDRLAFHCRRVPIASTRGRCSSAPAGRSCSCRSAADVRIAMPTS